MHEAGHELSESRWTQEARQYVIPLMGNIQNTGKSIKKGDQWLPAAQVRWEWGVTAWWVQ